LDTLTLGGRKSAFATIGFTNYLNRATVLFRSLQDVHPESPRFFLALDEPEQAQRTLGKLATVVALREIDFTAQEVFSRKTYYTPTEFATSVKARLLISLLRQFSRVTYLDPDIEVFQKLEVEKDLLEREILLTPHLVRPIPEDGRELALDEVQRVGIFNLGFISASSGSETALRWWDHTLQFHGDYRPGESFTDQKAAEQLVAMSNTGIIRFEGWNVAYWNLHERNLSDIDDVVFFHFSGFNPDVPNVLTKFYTRDGRHRYVRPDWLQGLLTAYSSKCGQTPKGSISRSKQEQTYFLGMPSLREIIRESHLDKSGYSRPPRNKSSFSKWLSNPGTGRGGSPTIPPVEMAFFMMRPDLQHAFRGASEGRPTDSRLLLDWMRQDSEAKDFVQNVFNDLGVPARGPAEAAEIYSSYAVNRSQEPKYGVNHVAYFGEKLGLAESSELLAGLIDDSGFPQKRYPIPNVIRQTPDLRFAPTAEGRPLEHLHTILSVNHDTVQNLWDLVGAHSTQGKRIGYWWWEVNAVTKEHKIAARKFNQIWVGSEFVRNILQGHLQSPVKLVRLPLNPRLDKKQLKHSIQRKSGPITFFHNSSLVSDPMRKNPLGVALAYMEAFAQEDGAQLRLHLTGAGETSWTSSAFEEIMKLTSSRDDIVVSTNRIDSKDLYQEIGNAHSFVSLHRSEGLGMNIRDAIQLGVPVIATGYGGNTDFMRSDTSYVVGYEPVQVKNSPHYPETATWAEPDLASAAEFMRAIAENSTEALDRAEKAKQYLHQIHKESDLIENLLAVLFDDVD